MSRGDAAYSSYSGVQAKGPTSPYLTNRNKFITGHKRAVYGSVAIT